MGRFFKICVLAMAVLILCESLKISKLQLESKTVSKCVKDFITKIKVYVNPTLRIRAQAESILTERVFDDMIDNLLKGFENNAIDLYGNAPKSYSIHLRIYFVDSVKSFEYMTTRRLKLQSHSSNDREDFLIILSPAVKDVQDLIKQFIEVFWKYFIVDVYIFYEDANHTVNVYTYYPFNENRCKDLTPVIHNIYVNGSFEFKNREVFPSKVDNLWQCPLKVITWHNPPYMLFDRQKGRISGMEAKFLSLLAAMLNFTMEIVKSPGGRGVVFDNLTTTGGFKMLENKSGDLFIGEAGCGPLEEKLFSTTTPYYGVYIKVLVKQPERYFPMEILLFPFDWRTWMLLVIVIMVKLISQLLIKRLTLPSREHSTRLCVTSWLVSILIIRSSYEGSVFKFLQNNPRKAVPNNLDEVVNAGYTILCPAYYRSLLIETPGIEDNLITYSIRTSAVLKEFKRLKGKYAMIIKQDFLSIYNDDLLKQPEFIILPDKIATLLECIYMPKFSYLSAALNHRIDDLYEHGIAYKIAKETLRLDNLENKVQVQKEAVSIPLNFLLGAFQLYLLMCAISVLVFILELLTRRGRKMRKFLNFFH